MKLIICFLFLVSVHATNSVKVGIFDVEPFSYMNKDKVIKGVSYRYLELIEKQASLSFEYILLPYSRVISSLTDGSIDIAMIYPSNDFDEHFIPLIEAIGNDNLIITKEKVENFDDLKDLTIAKISGGKYSPEFDHSVSIKKTNVRNYILAIGLFKVGRVDGIVIPRVALRHIINSKKLDSELFKNQFLLNHKKNWIHIRKGLDISLREKIKSANEVVLKNTKYEKLDDLYEK